MDSSQDNGIFATLEEKVQKAVGMVHSLRAENIKLTDELRRLSALSTDTTTLQQDFSISLEKANRDAEKFRAEAQRAKEDSEALRAERKLVRARIEKILGQIDQLAER